MTKSLVIVDSTAKGQTLKYLVGDPFDIYSLSYDVLAVSASGLQDIRPEDAGKHEKRLPQTVKTGIETLKSSVRQYRQVLIASNPDARGEAFADFCAREFGSENGRVKRIILNEITGDNLRARVQSPSFINSDEVNVYRARQRFESWLSTSILPELSLKRRPYRDTSILLSMLALKLVCERESAIENFRPRTTYNIRAEFKFGSQNRFEADLISIKGKKPNITDRNVIKAIVIDLRDQDFSIETIKRKKVTIAPPSPFMTASLLKDAEQQLDFSAEKTMKIARELYEGVDIGQYGLMGLITYYRTHEQWVQPRVIPEVREQIVSDFGVSYLPQQQRTFPTLIDETSEAIRPTAIKMTPKRVRKFLTADQYQLYSLIWYRFLASQMLEAEAEEFSFKIVAGPDARYRLGRSLTTILFRGFAQAYDNGHLLPIVEADHRKFENLNKSSKLELVDVRMQTKQTMSPQRFTESSLLECLQENGVDASENYDAVISFLFENGYLLKDDGRLIPSSGAFELVGGLIGKYPNILNFEFVHRVGELLAQIGHGELSLDDFADSVLRQSASTKSKVIKSGRKRGRSGVVADANCPLCGSDLIRQNGSAGSYLACINYPQRCSFARMIEEADGQIIKEKCDLCHRDMVVRTGPYGRFLACSGFPECKFTRPYSISVPCPVPGCSGTIVEKMSKSGQLFYGCSEYPGCHFSSKFKPVNTGCRQCKNSYLVVVEDEERGDFLRCPVCAAKYHLDLSSFHFIESVG